VGVVEDPAAGEAPKPSEKDPVLLGSSFAGGVMTGSGNEVITAAGGGPGDNE
jgi:hypothetical protein